MGRSTAQRQPLQIAEHYEWLADPVENGAHSG